MSEKPKRRRWQLHLSTLIMLSLVAGGLVHLNFSRSKGRLVIYVGDIDGAGPERQSVENGAEWYGFPFVAIVSKPKLDLRVYAWLSGIVANLIVSVFSLYIIAVILEWLIRRHEARKT